MGSADIVAVPHRYERALRLRLCPLPAGHTLWHIGTTVSTELFSASLQAFSRQAQAGPNREIVLVLDRTGGHNSVRLRVPEHRHLLFLPPVSPELQPAEHLRARSQTSCLIAHHPAMSRRSRRRRTRQPHAASPWPARPHLMRSAPPYSW